MPSFSDSSSGPSLDLSSASAAALASYSAPDTPPASDPPAAPQTTPQEPAQNTQVSGQTPPATPAPQVGDELVDIQLENGQTVKVPKIAAGGYLRHADYTRKTQEAAEFRRQLESINAQLAEREQQLSQIASNPVLLRQYAAYLAGQPDASQVDPNEIVTQEQAYQMQAQMQAQLQQFTQEQIAKSQQQIADERTVETYRGEINKTISALLDENPSLKAVDGIEVLLQKDAAALQPANMEDAKSALIQVAKQRATKLKEHFIEMQKQSAAAAAKLQNNGIEPPGGSGPRPQPRSFKLGDKGLTEAAISALLQSKAK